MTNVATAGPGIEPAAIADVPAAGVRAAGGLRGPRTRRPIVGPR